MLFFSLFFLFLEDQTNINLEIMRRGSASKSSMFKIQTEKNHFRDFVQNVDQSQMARLYPNLVQTIKKQSQMLYDLCYDFSEQSCFVKGLNYGCRNFGFSMPHSTIIIYRDWFPNAKQVKLTTITDSHEVTYEMKKMEEEEEGMWETQIDIEQNQVGDDTKLYVQIVTENGQIQTMPPPSSKIQSGELGYLRLDPDIPFQKHPKKQEIIEAYTLDLEEIPLTEAAKFLQDHSQILRKFNTLIIRNLFNSQNLINRHTLKQDEIEHFRDVISKCKNEIGLRAILEWDFLPGKRKYTDNLVQQNLFIEEQPGVWQYDLSKKEVIAFYLSNLSYYLTVFKLDGFHFKRIESFTKKQNGEIVIKCMNLMNTRIHQNGFTLASSKIQIPGLNQPILEGGLGFTFSYTETQNFMECKSTIQLRQKFDKILASSNCVPINLNLMSQQNELNLLFAVFTSRRGVFCKGSLKKNKKLMQKVLITRNQSQIFESDIQLMSVQDNSIVVQRDRAWILFNFSDKQIMIKLENANKMELINCFGQNEPVCDEKGVRIHSKSCCILEE